MIGNNLLLQRYEKVKIIKKTQHKVVQLFLNRNTGQYAVAKTQQASIVKNNKKRNILHQASFLQALQGYRGIPGMIWSGKTKQQKVCLIVQQLGDSLTQRFTLCNQKFSLKTVCMLGIQMIQIIKTIHDKCFVVSNISLQLFQFGKGEKCLNLYINDLSQCRIFRDTKTMVHVRKSTKQHKIDSPNIFLSSAVVRNQLQARKDDIESIFLILVYLLKGFLPWQQSFKSEQISKLINQRFIRQFHDSKLICQSLPKTFLELLEDCRSLSFESEPPYHWYILKLKSLLYINGLEYDYVFDWMINPSYIKSQAVLRNIPCIFTEKDEKFLQYLSVHIFPFVQLQEVEVRKKSRPSEQEVQQPKYQPYKFRPNISIDGNKLLKREADGHNQRNKLGTQRVEVQGNNILQRKKNKKQCQIM